MLKKTRKERNRKKTLNKRLSKNNKKHTFRRKNTKNLTKKNKMLGGHFCIFETPEGSKHYGCNACAGNTYKFTIPSRYFYYYGNEDTLFGFNSHLFKHLDKKKSLIDSLNDINFVKTPQNLVLFSLKYDKYPILKKFIDEIIEIINYNRLTYAILKHEIKTNDDNMFTSGPFVNDRYKDLMITWSKKPRLPTINPPLPIKSTVPYTKFVQLHSLNYQDRPKTNVCTPGKILTGDNDVTDSQKDNFIHDEQYNKASLTKEPLSDYMQSMLEFNELERQEKEQLKKELERQKEEDARIAAELQRKNQEEEARIAAELQRKKQEEEDEEKKLVDDNIKITISSIDTLINLINIESPIKEKLVGLKDDLNEFRETKKLTKNNKEFNQQIEPIVTYLVENGINKNAPMQQGLMSVRNNLNKDNNETKNRGLKALNIVLTEGLLPKIKAASEPERHNEYAAAPVGNNEYAAATVTSITNTKGLSKKEMRKKLSKMKKGEVLDEDSL